MQVRTGGVIHIMCGEAGRSACAQLEQLAAALPRLEEATLDDPLWGASPLARLAPYRAAAVVALPHLSRLDLRPVLPVCHLASSSPSISTPESKMSAFLASIMYRHTIHKRLSSK